MATQLTSNVEPDWCFLIRREEQAVVLRQKYLYYVARFERWDRRKAWLRFIVGRPMSALTILVKHEPLPVEWRRQPLNEDDFQHELFLSYIRGIS